MEGPVGGSAGLRSRSTVVTVGENTLLASAVGPGRRRSRRPLERTFIFGLRFREVSSAATRVRITAPSRFSKVAVSVAGVFSWMSPFGRHFFTRRKGMIKASTTTAIKAMISLFFVPGRVGACDRGFTRRLSTSLLKGCRAELLSRSTVYSGGRAIPCSFDSSSPTQIVFWLLTGMRETD